MSSYDAWPAWGSAQPLFPERQEVAPPQADAADDEPAGANVRHAGGARSVPWLTLLGFAFLTFNSVMAVMLHAPGDRAAIAFVAFSYLDLLALFGCLRMYETADPVLRARLKPAVWLLTTALTLLFSWKVAAVMPAAIAVAVWLMAFATVAAGFHAFFCYSDEKQ